VMPPTSVIFPRPRRQNRCQMHRPGAAACRCSQPATDGMCLKGAAGVHEHGRAAVRLVRNVRRLAKIFADIALSVLRCATPLSRRPRKWATRAVPVLLLPVPPTSAASGFQNDVAFMAGPSYAIPNGNQCTPSGSRSCSGGSDTTGSMLIWHPKDLDLTSPHN
jgi:hypothetical protein